MRILNHWTYIVSTCKNCSIKNENRPFEEHMKTTKIIAKQPDVDI